MHRILLVISDLGYGGAERQLVELANHLDRRRFDVHVCSLSDHVPLAGELDDRERRLHIIHKRWTFDVTVVFRLAALLRRLRIDLVHSYLFDAAIAGRLAGRLAGVTVVGSERNTDYRLKPRQLMAYRLTKRCVDLIIANSRAGAAFNSRVLGHDPALYRVVYNGVNTERFQPRDAAAVRRELRQLQDAEESSPVAAGGAARPRSPAADPPVAGGRRVP
jgi:glycosyltransferase involved in cell wall biosynthesis